MKTYIYMLEVCIFLFLYNQGIAQSIINARTQTSYATIQSAVNGASSGDTLTVAAGTYVVTSRLALNKSVTLLGANEATTIIDARAVGTDWGVAISVSNVTISNFSILPPLVAGQIGTSSGGGFALHTTNATTGITISHITVQNGNRTGIDVNGVTNLNLSYISSNNAAYGNGISLSGVVNGNVSHVTTSGNAWGGIAVYVSTSVGRGSSNITIDGTNCSISEVNKVYAQNESGLVNTNITVNGYDYTAKNSNLALNGYTWYQDNLTNAITYSNLINASSPGSYIVQLSNGTLYVGSGMSIQSAINSANAGGTIQVLAGTYNESITMNKLVDIHGAGIGNTILTKSVLMNAGTGSGRSKLRNLSVITTDSPYKVDTRYAIFIDGSGGNTGPVTIDSIKAKIYPSNPTVYGAGLLISPENNTINDVVISHCIFDSSYSHGIYIKNAAATTGTVSALQISNSSFNYDDMKIIAQGRSFSGYGLYILAPAASPTLIVDGMTVTNSTFNGNYRKGLYIESLKNASFSGVTASGNGEEGLDLNLKYGSYTNISFDKCTFINNSTNGITLNNGIKPDIHAKGRDDAPYNTNPASLSNVNITSSIIGYAGFGNKITNSPMLTGSSIQTGVLNYMNSGSVNCNGNWWGTIDAAVISSRINGVITFSPWWNKNYISDPHTSGWVWGTNSNLHSTIDSVQSGDTVNIAAGTYTEVGQFVINKDVSLIGANKTTTIIKPSQNTGLGNHLDASAWILVNSEKTFNLSNITLDGTGKLINLGILSHGHGTISSDSITHISYNQSGPDYQGTGIELYGSDMSVSNNSFDNIGRDGIFIGFGSVATINGNIYTGKGSGNFLDYGVELGRNGHATISNNTISNNLGVASIDGSISAGILVSSQYNPETPSGATITGNSLSHSTYGIYVSNGAVVNASSNTITNITTNGIFLTSTSGNTITGNTISAITNNGISLLGASSNILISNTISTCNFSAFSRTMSDVNAGNAAWAISFDGGSNNNTATGNIITANDIAVENWNGTGNVVAGNIISGNFYGVHNHTSNVILSLGNWWGDAKGPRNDSTNSATTGDTVSANVVYSPWWTKNYIGVVHPWSWRANSNLLTAINTVSSGDTLNFTGSNSGKFDVSKNIIVKFTTPPVFDSVTVSNGDLVLSSTVTVSGNLNLSNGNIVTKDSNRIVLDTNATNPTETHSGAIIGTVEVVPRSVGTGSISMLGFAIQAGNDNLAKVGIIRKSGDDAAVTISNQAGIATTWNIQADHQPTSGRQVVFSWLPTFDNNVDTTRIVVYRNEGSGWQQYAGPFSVSGTPRQVTVNTTGFSTWTIGSINNSSLVPGLLLNSRTISFPNIKIGQWKDTVVTVTNTGTDTLKITSITSTKSYFSVRPTVLIVPPSQIRNDTLRFISDSLGVRNALISFVSNATSSPDTVVVNGFGLGTTPGLALNQRSIIFSSANIGQWKDTIVTITNTGSDTLKITSITSTKSYFSVRPTVLIVLPSQTRNDTIRFIPDSIGVRNALISFVSNAATSPDMVVVSGFGLGTPGLVLNSGSITFPVVKIGQWKDTVVTVSNTGIDTLKITSITSTKNYFSVRPSFLTIPPSEIRNDTIRFIPDSIGVRNALVNFVGNAVTSPDMIAVTGFSIGTPGLALIPRSITFPTLQIGQWKDTIVAVTNTGTDTLKITSIMSTKSYFSVRPTVLIIPPRQTMIDTIRFTSDSLGTRNAIIQYVSNAAPGPNTIIVVGNSTISDIAHSGLEIPESYMLFQNYPNPFNPTTTIRFALPNSGTQYTVSLRVYDVLGREVATLLSEELPAGYHAQQWNAGNLSSGIYFYRLDVHPTNEGQAGSFTETKKLVLNK